MTTIASCIETSQSRPFHFNSDCGSCQAVHSYYGLGTRRGYLQPYKLPQVG